MVRHLCFCDLRDELASQLVDACAFIYLLGTGIKTKRLPGPPTSGFTPNCHTQPCQAPRILLSPTLYDAALLLLNNAR